MATLFYILLVFFVPGVPFTWLWFLISVLFSLAETGGRVVYRYTTDRSLAGHEEEA
ncbi:MAG TPA: hypothetical protein VLB73_02820 [Patescibacteria group bacterium]|nr:hypothetical protein [Patescibacteria group bacterium]